jgi:hypothetical protein
MKTVEEAIAILEKLRDKWCTQSQFLEATAGYSEDLLATLNKAQSRVIGQCNSDLYGAIGEIKEIF